MNGCFVVIGILGIPELLRDVELLEFVNGTGMYLQFKTIAVRLESIGEHCGASYHLSSHLLSGGGGYPIIKCMPIHARAIFGLNG